MKYHRCDNKMPPASQTYRIPIDLLSSRGRQKEVESLAGEDKYLCGFCKKYNLSFGVNKFIYTYKYTISIHANEISCDRTVQWIIWQLAPFTCICKDIISSILMHICIYMYLPPYPTYLTYLTYITYLTYLTCVTYLAYLMIIGKEIKIVKERISCDIFPVVMFKLLLLSFYCIIKLCLARK